MGSLLSAPCRYAKLGNIVHRALNQRKARVCGGRSPNERPPEPVSLGKWGCSVKPASIRQLAYLNQSILLRQLLNREADLHATIWEDLGGWIPVKR